MSKVNGQLRTCDRCGEKIFLKVTGEKERDGGFTRWSEFEKAGGWTHEYIIGDLCPACSNEYARIVEEFKQKQKRFAEEGAV